MTGFIEIQVNETCVIFNTTLIFCNATTNADWIYGSTIEAPIPSAPRGCSNFTVLYDNPFLPKVIPERCWK